MFEKSISLTICLERYNKFSLRGIIPVSLVSPAMINGPLTDNSTFKDHDHYSENIKGKIKLTLIFTFQRFEDQMWQVDTCWSSDTVGAEHDHCHQAVCGQA